MAVTILSGGIPVELNERIWSWDSSMQPYGSAMSVLGGERGDLRDPDHVWRTQRSVRTVVRFIARNIAQIPLHGFMVEPDGDRRRLGDDDALTLALKMPRRGLTSFAHMNALVIDHCLFERYAALKTFSPDGVHELVRLPPRRWRFERDNTGSPTAVLWQPHNGADVVRYSLDMVMWLDGYVTDQASTPMDSLFDLLTEQDESARYRTDLWTNGARMPGWIERPIDAPKWSREARERFRASWQQYAGGGVKAGKTPLLEGMVYHELQNGVTPEAAQQIESRKLSIAEVAAAFHIPPVFVGLLDNANYSNVTAYREQLYADVLGPNIVEIQQAFNARWVGDVAKPGQFVEFNVAEKLRMSFEQQSDIFQRSTGAPIMTRNEARRRVNLPQIDGADDLIVPLNVTTTTAFDAAAQGGTL